MGTFMELCDLKDYLPFIIFLLLSITGSLGSRTLVKEETNNREINISKDDFVNHTNSSLLTYELPRPLATPTGYGSDRFGFGPACSERDIDIIQMPNPTVPIEYSYITVVIENTCESDPAELVTSMLVAGGSTSIGAPKIPPYSGESPMMAALSTTVIPLANWKS